MHVGAEEAGPADQVVQVQGLQLRNRQELEVIVNSASLAAAESVRIVGIFSHLLNEVVQERTPSGSGTQLRDEERMLLAAFVSSQEHTAILAPRDRVDVDGWFDGSPGLSITGVPDLDDLLICGHNLRVQGLFAGVC